MNHLNNENSPYLREHASNPVDWYPWCAEAFDRARREDKPVFLSIGYSTCHWCHVMARESFEDMRVAEILNRGFISVKVDREEHPEVDSVYMAACTAMNGAGGWPMTLILTPEQQPFFAATYLPRDSGEGKMGLIDLLSAVSTKWATDRKVLIKAGRELAAHLSKEKPVRPSAIGKDFIVSAAKQLADSFDGEFGGFGRAPKFPSAPSLLFLLRHAHFADDKNARKMVDFTLQQMYRGGIFDHIGGGFARYSTDREWLAPHFEKTLYDNALLALVYTEAWETGHYALYREAAEATLDYCLRSLRSPGGGFYCAQDADSNGTEGAYYLFTPDEVCNVLGENEGKHFCECYDITAEGNFGGRSIPNLLLNQRWNMLPEGYGEYREKLREYRSKRLPLDTDNKILRSWNGIMLTALSRAYRAFGDRRYLEAADTLASYLNRFGPYASSCGGKMRFDAGLDSLAFHALGLLDYYGIGYDASALENAAKLADRILADFSSPAGFFYDTAENAEKLIFRPKTVYDGALPSANGAAAQLFDRLFRLTGDARYKTARDRLLGYIAGFAAAYPAGCASALIAAMSLAYPTRELVCVCTSAEAPSALYAVTEKYAPELSVIVKTPENAERLSALVPFTADMQPQGGKSAFYICSGSTCSAPIAVE